MKFKCSKSLPEVSKRKEIDVNERPETGQTICSYMATGDVAY